MDAMTHVKLGVSLLAALLVSACSPVGDDEAIVVQKVPAFHRPESCAVSADGKHVFVTNCASGEYGPDALFGLAANRGYISRLSLSPDGTLGVDRPTFVRGLSGPLGIAVLPRSTTRFRRGTLFVNVGYYKQITADARYVRLPGQLGTGQVIVSPDSGKLLGHIDCGPGGNVAKAIGFPLLIPNGMAFDNRGNLYVVETGADSGDILERRIVSRGGVMKIEHGAIDAAAAGSTGDGIRFMPVPGNPNGIVYDRETDSLYVVTCGEDDPFRGAVYRIPREQFGPYRLAPPIATGLGRCDGVARTRKGTLVVSLFQGGLRAVLPGGATQPIRLSEPVDFQYASDITLFTSGTGDRFLLLPEQDFKSDDYGHQVLWRIRLPAVY